MSEATASAEPVKAPEPQKGEKQGFIRPPAQGGKKEYTIPNGTRVKHN